MNKQALEVNLKEARDSLAALEAQFVGVQAPDAVARVMKAIRAHIEFVEGELNSRCVDMQDAA